MLVGLLGIVVDDLGNGEQPDEHRNEFQPAHEFRLAENQPLGAVDEVEPDGREKQAERGRHQSTREVVPGDAGDDGQRKQDQREKLRRSELEGKRSDEAGKENQCEVGNEIREAR